MLVAVTVSGRAGETTTEATANPLASDDTLSLMMILKKRTIQVPLLVNLLAIPQADLC